MAYPCAASSKLALPSVLRSFLRAEFTSESRFPGSLYNQIRPLSLHRAPLPSRRFQTDRCFSSVPRLQTEQSEQPAPSSNEPSIATESPSSTPEHVTEPPSGDGLKHGEGSRSKRPSRDDRKPRDTKWSKSKDEKPSRDGRKPRDAKWSKSKDQPFPVEQNKKREEWQIQKEALQGKFQTGWNPSKKLSPDALDGIRQLHAMAPERFTTPVLSEQFKVSPEAIRRILKSKWRASEPEIEDRRRRWEKRHDRIWSQMAELGLRPKRNRTLPTDDANVLYEDSATKP